MVTKPYKLNHPLYPHPLALEKLAEYKDPELQYQTFAGAYDDRYNQWYEDCQKDVIEGGVAPRAIWHYVTSIYRTRSLEGEKIYYKEYIQAHDKDLITKTFDHYVGKYQ